MPRHRHPRNVNSNNNDSHNDSHNNQVDSHDSTTVQPTVSPEVNATAPDLPLDSIIGAAGDVLPADTIGGILGGAGGMLPTDTVGDVIGATDAPVGAFTDSADALGNSLGGIISEVGDATVNV